MTPNDLALLKSQCAADLQSIGAGVGLPWGVQKERLERMVEVIEEIQRLRSILDNTPPTITPYESESFITNLSETITDHPYTEQGTVCIVCGLEEDDHEF